MNQTTTDNNTTILTTIEGIGVELSVKPQRRYGEYGRYSAKHRVFVSHEGDLVTALWEKHPKHGPLPYTRKGEDAEVDARWRAFNGIEKRVQKAIAQAAVGLPGKFSFSIKCGCSMCPCSPGTYFQPDEYTEDFRRDHATYVTVVTR